MMSLHVALGTRSRLADLCATSYSTTIYGVSARLVNVLHSEWHGIGSTMPLRSHATSIIAGKKGGKLCPLSQFCGRLAHLTSADARLVAASFWDSFWL
jgi:hypothetical protein